MCHQDAVDKELDKNEKISNCSKTISNHKEIEEKLIKECDKKN